MVYGVSIIGVQILKQKHIDILYLCAGAYNIPRRQADTGYNNIFQINFLSQCFMAKELIGMIPPILTPFNADAQDEKTQNFVATYQEQFGEIPNQFAADAYDCVYAVYEACKLAGIDGSTADGNIVPIEITAADTGTTVTALCRNRAAADSDIAAGCTPTTADTGALISAVCFDSTSHDGDSAAVC